MRYRQTNQHFHSGDEQAKALIKSDDILSTQEQEEVIAYFARSLRSSTQFLKVVVCLHAVLALVYTMLLMSGSLLMDLSVDASAAASLQLLAQQQQQQSQITRTTSDPAAPTPDPLEVLAALDAEQRAAQRKFVHDYMERRGGGRSGITTTTTTTGRALFLLSAGVMVYSVGLLLWTAWSGYQACRQLRVNVDDLTATEPRDLLGGRRRTDVAENTTAGAVRGGAGTPSAPQPAKASARTLRALRQRITGDPVAAQYAAAALAALASLFWIAALLHRQHATQLAYVAVGLEAPSVLSTRGVTDAMLEYVLAVWQPLFHGGIGLLLRSMLDTRENLVALSKLKYRFDKV